MICSLGLVTHSHRLINLFPLLSNPIFKHFSPNMKLLIWWLLIGFFLSKTAAGPRNGSKIYFQTKIHTIIAGGTKWGKRGVRNSSACEENDWKPTSTLIIDHYSFNIFHPRPGPIGSSAFKRSFSALRHLKTGYRATMTENCL